MGNNRHQYLMIKILEQKEVIGLFFHKFMVAFTTRVVKSLHLSHFSHVSHGCGSYKSKFTSGLQLLQSRGNVCVCACV